MNYKKGYDATRKGAFAGYNHNLDDANKGSYRTGRYTNNPHCNYIYNKKHRFGSHNSPSRSDYCTFANNDHTMDNPIPDKDR